MTNKIIDGSSGSSTGGVVSGEFDTVVSSFLNVYTMRLNSYPVANAFTLGGDTSQEFWGLQGDANRSGQNTSFRNLLSFGFAEGVGVLSLKSIVPLTQIANQITSAEISFGVLIDIPDAIPQATGNTYDVSTEDSEPRGFRFSGDGTRMYMLGTTNNRIYQYSLSVAYDITSTVTLEGNFDPTSQEAQPRGMCFSADGTKFIVVGINNNVRQYSLTTPRDLTGTVTFDGGFVLPFSTSFDAHGVTFNNDGSKIIVGARGSSSTQRIYQRDLTTNYDATSGNSNQQLITTAGMTATDVLMSPDGSTLFGGSDNNTIREFNLATNGTIVGMSGAGLENVDTSGFDSDFKGFDFVGDGRRLVGVGNNSGELIEISIGGNTHEFDLDVIIDGTTIETLNYNTTSGIAFHLTNEEPSPSNNGRNDNKNFELVTATNVDISNQDIVIELVTKNIVNPDNNDVKIGFGLNTGDFNSPVGNYERSELNILM